MTAAALWPPRPPLARGPVVAAALAQAVALSLGSVGYGYHRDELYFRMLPAAWGYVDQPPLVPFLARTMAGVVDQAWALRLPATLATALSVVLVALLTRELGGQRGAQTLAAWGYAFSALPLMLGHLLLTSTLDQAFWLAVVLAVLRALRGDARWWAVAGAVAGVATYSRLLVAVLGWGSRLGCWPSGRDSSAHPRAVGGSAGRGGGRRCPTSSSRARTAGRSWRWGPRSRRTTPPRSARWRCPSCWSCWGPSSLGSGASVSSGCSDGHSGAGVGFLAVAFAVLVAFTLVSGAQPHYPVHLLAVMYAAGCVPVAAWLARARRGAGRSWPASPSTRWSRVVLALPVVPLGVLGRHAGARRGTAGPGPGRVAGVRRAGRRRVPDRPDGGRTARGHLQLRRGRGGGQARPCPGSAGALSGHNALYDAERPAADVDTVVLVGGQLPSVAGLFSDVSGPRQARQRPRRGQRGAGPADRGVHRPVAPWTQLWPRFRHLD